MPALSAEEMAAERRRLAEAIERACRPLGVECECPFRIPGAGEDVGDSAAYLADFGGPLGMVIDVADGDWDSPAARAKNAAAKQAGLYVSRLSPGYPIEDEEHLFECLVDWGHFGSLAKLGEGLRRKRALRRSPYARP